jgi:hypothetical protein
LLDVEPCGRSLAYVEPEGLLLIKLPGAWNVRSFIFFALTCSGLCLIGRSAHSETLEELKGLSIAVTWTYAQVDRHPPDVRWVTRTGIRQRLLVYVSLRGNIFHEQVAINDEGHEARGFSKTTIDKASSRGHDLLESWTLLDGHLTQILQEPKGIRIYTLAIDPTKLTCTFYAKDEPDQSTGEFFVFSPHGPWEVEIQQRRIENATCSVKRGNLFIPDRE